MAIGRAPIFFLLVVLCIPGHSSVDMDEAEEGVSWSVRDAQTGAPVDAELILVPEHSPRAPVADELDRAIEEAGPGQAMAYFPARESVPAVTEPMVGRLQATGFRPLLVRLRPGDDLRGRVFWMSPTGDRTRHLDVQDGPAQRPETLQGRVLDSNTLDPVRGGRVILRATGDSAITGPDGAYSLPMPGQPAGQVQGQSISLEVMAPDFPVRHYRGIPAGGGDVRLDLHLGSRSPAGADHLLEPPARLRPRPLEKPVRVSLPRGSPGEPPASITVGFADADCTKPCCTGNCSYACVFELEDYVRRGLADEWIASWPQHALRAGAVAYRSYGAWHVFNPPEHGAYDLCSSACCQVNTPGTVESTDLAVAATPGLMLEREQAVFRSEYSAENNCLVGDLPCTNPDLSCGDGFAGSPALAWPCLEDPVGAGHACFGHGRGMSQWGNQRWSTEPHFKTWKWQLDHYYNDQGQGSGLRTAVISQVLGIDKAWATPVEPEPGQTVTLGLEAKNRAAEANDQVIVGASIRLPGGPFIDDPANDQPVALQPGINPVQRSFDLPEDLPPGIYEVHLSLYLDVNEDGQITGEDLLQDLIVIEQGLMVGGGIFRDRFEGSLPYWPPSSR